MPRLFTKKSYFQTLETAFFTFYFLFFTYKNRQPKLT